jgi:hypothetical protein
MAQLRVAGERVVVELPGLVGQLEDSGCDRKLVKTAEGWQVQ